MCLMASAAYDRFLESLRGTYDQWHDGTGYDLDALRQSTPAERIEAEAHLVVRLKSANNWHDVEALAALGTPSAQAAVECATEHRDVEVRKFVRELLAPPPPPRTAAEEEEDTIRCIEMGAINYARSMPTPRVKSAVLDRARHVNPEARARAAVLLLELCGQRCNENLLQRFTSQDVKEMRDAWTELRTLTGV